MIKDKIINITISQIVKPYDIILPTLEITKIMNLPIIQIIFKIRFLITLIIILI